MSGVYDFEWVSEGRLVTDVGYAIVRSGRNYDRNGRLTFGPDYLSVEKV